MAFSDFQYGFRSSQLTADLLTVVSDRIVILGLLKLYVAHDTSKAFGRAWHAGLSHKLRSYRSSGQIGLFSSFLSNRQLWDVLDRKSSKEYPGNTAITELVLSDWSNNTGGIDVKMDGSVLEEKPSFKMLGLIFSSKLDWDSYIISIAETASKKIGALICPMISFSWGCSVSL